MTTSNPSSHSLQGYSMVSRPSKSGDSQKLNRSRLKGYPMLAHQIEMRPEMTIFRRFGALNAGNLLYLQAELVSLEEELQRQQLADSNSNDENKTKYAVNWCRLRRSLNTGDSKQLDLINRIREVLWQYNEALIQQCQILSYPEPDRYDIEYMQTFLESKEHMDLSLLGPDAGIWGSISQPHSYSPDLVALCPRRKEDPFSSWVVDKAITKLVHWGWSCFLKSPRTQMPGIIGYEDAKVFRITYWISSVIASLLPIGSIIILHKVHSTVARLGIIAAFNVLVSVCLNAFTNAKRAEVFAITAAFAAVQVVFVSADRTS